MRCQIATTLTLALFACTVVPEDAGAADVLIVEDVAVPPAAPAGATVPVSVRLAVAETLREGWRVSVTLTMPGAEAIVEGPVDCVFGPDDEPGAVKTARFSVSIPEDAEPGRYAVDVDHYDRVDGEWVHVAYRDRNGQAIRGPLAEIEITDPLPKLTPNPPQRKLRPGEVHAVYECEEFDGMDGRGEDLSLVSGWTWHSHVRYSRLRAAVNTSGEGTIYGTLEEPLPPGRYKLFVRAGNAFWTGRVGLGDETVEFTPLRSNWWEIGVVETDRPARRLTLEVLRKPGQYAIADSIYVTNDLDTEAHAGLDPSRQFLPVDARPVKDERTIYTTELLAAARARLAEYPSLREEADKAIAAAREIAQRSDRELWELLAPTRIERTYYVNQNAGCPVCGLKIKQVDPFHPWILEPFEHPYKMKCPVCGRRFPTNDFAAGEMTGGEYPDDGTGCVVGDETYRFIGEYTHWVYREFFNPYVRQLTEAVALTDDPRLAHKLAVMLLRAAQQWPNSEDRYLWSYDRVVGHRAGGVTDRIWSSYEGRTYGCAYDAVFPFLDADDELLTLAREEIPQIETHGDLRLYIEENLLRRIGQQYCDTAIQGNAGYHHRGMAWLLLALDDPGSERFPDCPELLDFLYYRIYGALRYFPNLIAPDGSSFESTGYNSSRLNMVDALSVLERYFAERAPNLPRERYPSLWDDPRFAAQFDYYTDYMLLDRWLPTVGDAGGRTIIPEHTDPERMSVVAKGIAARAWARYRSPKMARVAYGLDDTPPEPTLWSDLPLAELAAARQQAPNQLPRRTQVQDPYGLVFLRSGEGESRRTLWAWYGQLLSHAHSDSLLYGLAGHGLDLLPDLGYPKSWEHASRWESHSLTHNTITVDGAEFLPGRVRGSLRALGSAVGTGGPPLLQIAQTEMHGDNGELARRMLALVDLGPEDFYVLDLMDVRGGSEHVLSYHGPQAPVSVEGVELVQQQGGTVAGPAVEYGDAETPLAHMTDVRRGHPTGTFSLDYALGDGPDTHVRLHQIPDSATTLALGTGRPPSQPDAYTVRYSLQMRSGQAPLEGRYATVVEPYLRRPLLDGVTRLLGDTFGQPSALRIGHGQGADLVLISPEPGQEIQVAGVRFDGRCGLVRFIRGEPHAVVAYEFTRCEGPGFALRAEAALTGEIVACDYETRSVTVRGIEPDDRLVGRHMRIFNALRTTMHEIVAVTAAPEGARLTLATTALRHEGWVAGVGNATIRDGAPSPWALTTFLAGARLVSESGDASWRIRDAAGGWHSAPTGTRIGLVAGPDTSSEQLNAALSDVNSDGAAGFRIYEYGPGDRVEIVSFAELRRAKAGGWTTRLSPGVRLDRP